MRSDVPAFLLATGAESRATGVLRAREGKVADLYGFSRAPESPTLARLGDAMPVASDVVVSDEALVWQAPLMNAIPTDALGRLVYATQSQVERDREMASWRLDPADGSHIQLGTPSADARMFFLLSPSRDRIFSGNGVTAKVWDGDQSRELSKVRIDETAFMGEDFYFAFDRPEGATGIARLAPNGQPQTVVASAGLVGYVPIRGSRPQLLLFMAGQPYALLDTTAFSTINLPYGATLGQFVSTSDDGQWLLFQTTDTKGVSLLLFNWSSGKSLTLDAASVGRSIDVRGHVWRPARHELWISTTPGGFAVWKETGSPKLQSGSLASYPEARGSTRAFTPDGAHWFSQSSFQSGIVFVGQAEVPDGPVFALNPTGTTTQRYWLLADGRLLVEAYPLDARRNDIYLVDPDTGTRRAMASAAQVVMVGTSRALVLDNWEIITGTGKLALIDLATSARTVFAEDVYAIAVERVVVAIAAAGVDASAEADALAPGTTVAYLVRNRLESPYDGLWVMALP